jgi:hypothetical protein
VFVYISSLKVAALLSNCIVVEQQAGTFFLSEGIKTSGIYRRMLENMGKTAWHRKMYTN